MLPEAPSDDMPVRSVRDPVSPLSPAFDVAITNIHDTPQRVSELLFCFINTGCSYL